MLARVRRTLTMAERVLAFARANPPSDAGQEALARGDALALQERRGRAAVGVAVDERRACRRQIHQHLRHLVRTAQVVGDTVPLPGTWRLPPIHSPYRSYETAARQLVESALPVREPLTSAGLGATLLEEVSALIDRLDQAGEALYRGKEQHIGARAELEAVRTECVTLVGLLDGVYQSLLRTDPEKLAAWEAARDVALVVVPRRRAGEMPVDDAALPSDAEAEGRDAA